MRAYALSTSGVGAGALVPHVNSIANPFRQHEPCQWPSLVAQDLLLVRIATHATTPLLSRSHGRSHDAQACRSPSAPASPVAFHARDSPRFVVGTPIIFINCSSGLSLHVNRDQNTTLSEAFCMRFLLRSLLENEATMHRYLSS